MQKCALIVSAFLNGLVKPYPYLRKRLSRCMKHILVVEDENSLLEMIQLNLELEGFTVTTCTNGKKALEFIPRLDDFELVILDVMLPEVSGLTLCESFRLVSQVPILFLSAKGTTTDRINGLKLGANDYLPKPFDLEELLLRVNNLVKIKPLLEHQHALSKPKQLGDWTINWDRYSITHTISGVEQTMTKREIELLDFFFAQPDRVISRDELLNTLWGTEQFPSGRTIDNYILNFRKIFEPDSKTPIYFHSIRGVGYRFTPEGEIH